MNTAKSRKTIRGRVVGLEGSVYHAISKFLFLLTLIIFTFIVASCGGGGGDGGVTTISGRSAGEIEGLGSIIVNGVEFETESAEVQIEGETASINDLQEGMVVEIEGTFDANGLTGTANTIFMEDNVEGPITSMTETTLGLIKTMDVMGQPVVVEAGLTNFDNNDPLFTFASLSVGQVVEVTGFTRADGTVMASFIEKKADDLASFLTGGGILEVKGPISTLNMVAESFSISGLTIDFSGVAVIDDLENAPNGVLAIGLLVEAKGTQLVGSVLTAISLEVKVMGLRADDANRVEVEGLISNLNTANQTLMVAGQMVDFSNAAFRGGIEDELANNIRIEAQGSLAGGTLNATRITFKESVRIEANAVVVSGSLTIQGLPGITITADPAVTEFRDVTNLAGITSGDNLRIRARLSGSSGTTLVAVRLELKSNTPDTRLILQGPVDSFNPVSYTVTILGITVDTSTIADDDFEEEDTSVGRAAFFSIITVGSIVKARADIDLGTSVLTWDQIELEIED